MIKHHKLYASGSQAYDQVFPDPLATVLRRMDYVALDTGIASSIKGAPGRSSGFGEAVLIVVILLHFPSRGQQSTQTSLT